MQTLPSKTELNVDRSRRELLRDLALGALATQVFPRSLRARQQDSTIASAKFADVLSLREGVWAVISKPLGGGFETTCNGAFAAGSERVVMFEAFASANGANWVLDACRQATGRLPTDIVMSHKHSDHVGGIEAFTALDAPPTLWITETLRGTLPEKHAAWTETAELIEENSSRTLDLGGRSLELMALGGHTESDIVAVVDGKSAFCGDLIWKELFPNYTDAQPQRLTKTVRSLIDRNFDEIVPGHGGMPTSEDLALFVQMLDAVEEAARRSHEAGTPAKDAAAAFELPTSTGEWILFNPSFFERAFQAWYRELES